MDKQKYYSRKPILVSDLVPILQEEAWAAYNMQRHNWSYTYETKEKFLCSSLANAFSWRKSSRGDRFWREIEGKIPSSEQWLLPPPEERKKEVYQVW